LASEVAPPAPAEPTLLDPGLVAALVELFEVEPVQASIVSMAGKLGRGVGVVRAALHQLIEAGKVEADGCTTARVYRRKMPAVSEAWPAVHEQESSHHGQ
jgi:hypothetical protein